MWSKINELSRQSLSQMQIAMKLGISRDTVRRYQRMNEKEFEGLISSEILRRKRKLEAFEGFIKQLLQDCPVPVRGSNLRPPEGKLSGSSGGVRKDSLQHGSPGKRTRRSSQDT